MPAPLSHLVIVGAALSGLRTAQALRRSGYEGRLTMIGDEERPPYDRPPLSKAVLSGKWDPERTALLRDEDTELGIDWRLGQRASGLDLHAKRVRLASGEEVPFDALVVATGSRARTLPGTPQLEGIHTLRTLDDCLAIRDALDRSPRVCVLGAGFIGAEVAATCRERGLAVTMLEALPAPLARGLGQEMGAFVGRLHTDQGVDLRCSTRVEGFLGEERIEALALSDGSRVETDLVVVGVGAAPVTDWLEGSGLELDDGVVCEASCRTTRAPFVAAVGDVARWPNPLFGESMRLEHWTNATEQADHVAATLLGGEAGGEPFAPVPFVWSDQYDRKIQIAGRFDAGDESRLVDGSLEERRFVTLYAREGRLRGVLGFNRPRLVMKLRRLIREGVSLDEAVAEI